MKKTTILLCTVALFVGCSHNAVQYSDGIGFETTTRPDTGNFGITFRYGKIFSAVVRENTEVEMTGDGSGTGGTNSTEISSASSSGTVKMKVGRQITGYYVDAIKASATPENINTYYNNK